MNPWKGSLLVTIAAAAVPRRVSLPCSDATLPYCGTVLEDAEYAWLQG